jgi:hypothetical protein
MGTDTLQPGELVDLRLPGMRVADPVAGHLVLVGDSGIDTEPFEVRIPSTAQFVVTRVAPREWPPQKGDVWASPRYGGEEWVAAAGAGDIVMTSLTRPGSWFAPGKVSQDEGPMVLVRRRGWTPPDPDAELSTVDEAISAAQVVAHIARGLSAGLPLPASIQLGEHGELHLVKLQMKSNATAAAAAWAESFRLPALVIDDAVINTSRPWRGHQSAGEWCGWDVAVWTAVDEPAEPITEPVLVDERGDAEKTAQVEEDAAERRSLEADAVAELAAESVEDAVPDWAGGIVVDLAGPVPDAVPGDAR